MEWFENSSSLWRSIGKELRHEGRVNHWGSTIQIGLWKRSSVILFNHRHQIEIFISTKLKGKLWKIRLIWNQSLVGDKICCEMKRRQMIPRRCFISKNCSRVSFHLFDVREEEELFNKRSFWIRLLLWCATNMWWWSCRCMTLGKWMRPDARS